jgi:Predicted transcriptional regulator
MTKSCRFAVAVHVVSVLALNAGAPCTSEWIAGSVNTNPVVIRRILSALGKAGLVRAIRGSNGGALLARAPEAITLLEIARAVEEDERPALHHQPPNPQCPVGRTIQPVLRGIIGRAEAAREAELAVTRLSDVLEGIRAGAA